MYGIFERPISLEDISVLVHDIRALRNVQLLMCCFHPLTLENLELRIETCDYGAFRIARRNL